MSIDPYEAGEGVRDGLSGAANPIPRQTPEQSETPAETAADDAALDAAQEQPSGTGDDAAGDAGTANSAGGLAPVEDAGDDGGNSAARGQALGLNEAAGPAEEKDNESPDDRGLTTDVSPSD